MYRDDEAARAAYVAALERKAARVDALEERIRELEAENRELHAAEQRERRAARPRAAAAAPATAPAPAPAPLSSATEVQVDWKLEDYVAELIKATDPRLTDGILSGALGSDDASVLDAARGRARNAGRRYVTPADVRGAALEVLPRRIMMIDPEVDPRGIVRAILDVVKSP